VTDVIVVAVVEVVVVAVDVGAVVVAMTGTTVVFSAAAFLGVVLGLRVV